MEGHKVRSAYSALMQSRFFNPAFNSAIFDGPVRIYFAQFHESAALKIYFLTQQKLTSELQKAKELSKQAQANILVMMYPSVESFELSFEEAKDVSEKFCVGRLHEDVVIGVRGPIEDNDLEPMMNLLSDVLKNWNPVSSYEGVAEL